MFPRIMSHMSQMSSGINPNKKQCTTFMSTLGSVPVASNPAKIAAICDERNWDLKKRGDVMQWAHLVGDSLKPDMPSWKTGGFSLSMTSLSEAPCNSKHFYPLLWASQESFEKYELPHATLIRSAGAYEALAGGLFTTLHGEVHELEKCKSIERIILGDEKATIAESLTAEEKVEFRGIMKGLEASFAFLREPPFHAVDDLYIDYPNVCDSTAKWIRQRAKDCAKMLPHKFVRLVLEADERPFACYSFVRELLDYFGDYARALEVFQNAAKLRFEDAIAGEALDNTDVPIAERIALVQNVLEKLEADNLSKFGSLVSSNSRLWFQL
jgi:hypothetical protein